MSGPPRRLRVGARTYTVEVSTVAGLEAKVSQQSSSCVGESNHTQQAIRIDPDQHPDQVRDTMLHEVLHACWDLLGLCHTAAGKHEELVVNSLTPALLDVLRRNPKLVEYLTG